MNPRPPLARYLLEPLTMIDRSARAGLVLALPVAGLSLSLFEGLEAVFACGLGWVMLAIALSDARRFIVPDWLSLPAIPLGLLAAALTGAKADPNLAVLQHLAAALLAGLAFYALSSGFRRLRGYRGLGLGDVKLAAAAGAWTGPEGVTLVVLVATFGALAFVLWLQLTDRGNVGGRTLIPFGAFLAPAIWLVWSALRIGAT